MAWVLVCAQHSNDTGHLTLGNCCRHLLFTQTAVSTRSLAHEFFGPRFNLSQSLRFVLQIMASLVKEMGLTEFGRKEPSSAEPGMPGLLAFREEFGLVLSLRGLSIDVSVHTTTQTDVLVETLQVLGATVRWASCNIFSIQDHVAAGIAKAATATETL